MKHRHSFAGLALIDSLIALLILSIGMFVISRFQNHLVYNAAEIKTRVEAKLLAQELLESFRQTTSSRTELAVLLDTDGGWTDPTEIIGNRAIYQRSYQVIDTDWDTKTVTVKISWENAESQHKSLEISSILTYHDLIVSGWLATGAGNQKEVSTPSNGVTEQREQTYATLPQGSIDNLDGTFFFQRDGAFEVMNAAGEVKVVINSYPLTIAGQIYYDGDIGQLALFASNFGHCVVLPDHPAIDLSNKTYHTAHYTCYVAAGWFGSIGVVGIADNETGCPGISRAFVTKNIDSSSKASRPGIYQSFVDQDFVLSKFGMNDPSCDDLRRHTSLNLSANSGEIAQNPSSSL